MGIAKFFLARLSADVGFVRFNDARKPVVAVHLAHVLADFVAHAKRSRIRDPELALQFLGRDAMPGSREEVHGIEPLLQRRMRAMKDGPDHGENLKPAPRALIGRMATDAVKLARLAALRALDLVAVPKPHEVVQAAIVIRELGHKLVDRRAFCHGSLHRMKEA